MGELAQNLVSQQVGTGVGTRRTDIPARMDRLPWTNWHWLIVAALGITWILDGLEVTVVGAIGSVLKEKATLGLTSSQVGFTATAYLLGAVAGSLFFGWLTDRAGRKKLFMITLLLYLFATVASAFSWNLLSFVFFRFLTGAGIGGEYSAVNSAIDELIPARRRGWTDLAINGSWWVGTAAGAGLTIVLLNPHLISHTIGWRLCFGLGGILGLSVLLIRRYVPESPRWLMTHGRMEEADQVVHDIEETVQRQAGVRELPPPGKAIVIKQRGSIGFGEIARVMFQQYPTRAVLCLTLMITQAFLYNAIFFTYALVLTTFYKVPDSSVGYYIFPFAVGNFFGPLVLGRFFDSWGRRQMIALTYGMSAVLLAITGYLFMQGVLNALTQTLAWSVIFFFASAGASSAYLTVSEIFPMEMRAMAIAFIFAVGTGVGGAFAPWFFGKLIEKSRESLFVGDLIGSGFMLAGAAVALIFGVAAERRSLEDIATPLSAASGHEPLPGAAGAAAPAQ